MIFKHINEVNVLATFSECLTYRYRLDISLKSVTENQGTTVCAIMQNPSVANSEIADKSAQFLEKLVFLKDYEQFSTASRLIIVNQFAYIQTKDFSGSDEHIGSENDQHIQDALSESDIILVAWGSSNTFEHRKIVINGFIRTHNDKVLLKGKSHPSRASYEDYISTYN